MSHWTEVLQLRGIIEIEHRRKGELISYQKYPNLIMDSGKAITAMLLGGQTSALMAYLELGSGQVLSSTAGTLIAPYVDGGLARAQATSSNTTTTKDRDTAQFVYTWSCLLTTASVTEEGIFTNSAAGDLIATQTFTAVAMATGDTIKCTHSVVFG